MPSTPKQSLVTVFLERTPVARRVGSWSLGWALIGVVLLLVGGGGTPALASDTTSQTFIGSVRNVEGNATLRRRSRDILARRGMRVFNLDVILTGPESTVALVLRDETEITIGPESEVSLDRYVYEPEKQQYGSTTSILKGTAMFVTGALAKVAPDQFEVKTPVSTIGIRGTRFVVEVEE